MGSLSEDLRLGAMLNRQAFGDYESTRGRTCAVAAIAKARGWLRREDDDEGIRRVEAELDRLGRRVACPKCQMENSVGGVVVHLNDFHRMKREEIADWLALREKPATHPEAVVTA